MVQKNRPPRRPEVQEPEMALSPFALSVLGIETPSRRRRTEQTEEVPEAVQNMPEMRAARPSRRAASHYNAFQTVSLTSNDDPPTYAAATRYKQPFVRHPDFLREELPKYSATVNAEAKLLLQLESINPLHDVSESEWKEVYLVLRGTLLGFYRVKDGGPGKLLRSYTLQHAEIGLATDTNHTILVPQSRFAHLIPSSQRKRAWQKDPDLFKPIKQTIMRLRVEMDQILLADSSEECISGLINDISAGTDIAHSIDERSIPRQCTVPRRRRRQRPDFNGDISDPALLAEQERILRDMYPALAEQTELRARPELVRTTTRETTSEPLPASIREEDDLDFAVMREDFNAPSTPAPSQTGDSTLRPGVSRQTTASTIASTHSTSMMYASSSANFDASGKWQPPNTRTEAQIQRYVKRCMPVLTAEAVRASDVLICNGKRVKINWRMELLEEWELQPPSYKSHHFNKGLELERSKSQSSAAPSGTQTTRQSSRSVLGTAVGDQIEPVDTGLANLELSKVLTATDKGSPTQASSRMEQGVTKAQDAQTPGSEVHGVVFCF